MDSTPEDDAELQGVDTDFDVKPTGVEVDTDYASILGLMALGNKIKRQH